MPKLSQQSLYKQGQQPPAAEAGGTAVAERPTAAGLLAKYAAPAKPVVTDGLTYVGFGAGEKSQSAANQRAAGINEGDPFLSRGGRLERLIPFRFVYVHATQLWERTNSQYETMGVVESPPERGSKYRQLIESVIIALTPGGPVAATCGFRTAKCGAILSAMEGVEKAGDEGWIKLSPAHAATGQISEPRFRYTVNVGIRRRTVKGGELAGTLYYEASGSISPMSAADWKQVGDYLGSEEGAAALGSGLAAYEGRLSHLKSFVGK
jgi:hypothetical protein